MQMTAEHILLLTTPPTFPKKLSALDHHPQGGEVPAGGSQRPHVARGTGQVGMPAGC